MMQFTLTMLDTSGIQNYIFNSNRLQENIGASELVYRATTLWAFQALADLRHNIKFDDHQWSYIETLHMEKDGLDVEVIYAGGGNTFILFRDEEQARQTTGRLTRRILKEASGLTVVAQHLPFDWENGNLSEKRQELLRNLAAHKQVRQPSVPLLGLGVSAVCQSTGLPAVRNDTGRIEIMGENVSLRLDGQKDDPPRLLSRETVAKIGWRDSANKRLKRELKKEMGIYDFPFDVDKLGRIEGDESYVAVIHADGNGMGNKFSDAIKDINDTRTAIDTLRAYSKKVNEAGLFALRQVIGLVVEAVKDDRVPYEEENGKKFLPIRPLVFGGDDLTLLCNGQIGVSLAAAYLKAFEEAFEQNPVKGLEKVRARAGVAIVKMHYPFARAYQLSEELAKSAKHFIKNETNDDCSAFDWHYATGGLSGELDLIREREYTVRETPFVELMSKEEIELKKDKKHFLLHMRPLRLWKADGDQGRSWHDGVEKIVNEFNDLNVKDEKDKYWSKRKNKVVELRTPLRSGPDSVKTYLSNFSLHLLPETASKARETGWIKIDTSKRKEEQVEFRCVYFDAVELFDQYLPLEKEA